VTILRGPEVPTDTNLTWVQQPAPTTGEIGGAAQFSFTVRTAIASPKLIVVAQKFNVGNVSSRFTIMDEIITRVTSPEGSFTEASFLVQIDKLVASDQSTYTFHLGVDDVLRTPPAMGALLRVVTALPPVITAQPANVTAIVGGTASFSVTAIGKDLSYQWRRDGTPISGATMRTLTLTGVQSSDLVAYSVVVTNPGGTVTSSPATLTLTVPPVITAQPQGASVMEGSAVTLQATATGTPNPTFVWRKDGVVVPGASASSLVIQSATLSDGAQYTVTIANSAGSVTSNVATLAVVRPGRIVNLAILTSLPAAGESFTLGYVVGGAGTSGNKSVLVRAAGPSLAALGVGGTLPDPRLELFAGANKTGENDNWGGSSSLAAAFASAGAFPYGSASSLDAAAVTQVSLGDNSVRVSSGGGSGTVIAEIYDFTPPANVSVATPRLLNVSVLKALGTGLTAGFVIAGGTPQTVLVRAIGPTLASTFGVGGAVADPQIAVFSGPTVIAVNDDWSASLADAFVRAGAFPLPAGSRDAAVLATLPPGNYTVEVSGVNNTTGIALVEVYEVR
jgi:hypothetical protein